MPSRSLLTIMIIAFALSAVCALALVQVSRDGSQVLAVQRAAQPVLALQDAMLPGQVEALRVDALSGVLREVERDASKCLGTLSPTTRVLLLPQGQGRLLNGLCDERASAAEALIAQLRTLPSGEITLGTLAPREVATIGAQVSLIGALTRRYDAALAGAYQVALTSLLSTVLALGAAVVMVAGLSLLRMLRAVVAATSAALAQVREVPALALVGRRELRTTLDRALDVGTRRAPGEAPSVLYFFALERPDWAHGDDGADERWREVLSAAQGHLAARVRGDDMACALVSDELVLLARRVADLDQAKLLGQRIMDCLDVPCDVDGERYQPDVHGGFALYPDHATDADALVRGAEKALREAKRQGHRQLVCFSHEDDDQAQVDARAAIDAELPHALARGQLSLAYQPVVNLRKQGAESVEALLRWQHPTLGEVSPSTFIPLAEQSNLILPIGEWVLTEALRQVRAWRGEGHEGVRVAVNVSVRQLLGQDVAALVSDTLAQFDLGGDALLLEVTEAVLMQERERAWKALAQVREIGVHVAIDDVGTGYSSLGQLASLPLDYLKIDGSFISGDGLQTDAQRAVIRSVIGLAEGLGVQVVAEAVEDETVAAYLADAGVRFAQGFLFCHPVAADEVDWAASYADSLPQDGDPERLLNVW
ncbi:MAG: GGDEF domain-containing phosphodiesterase [Pseudomonadota bacterium]